MNQAIFEERKTEIESKINKLRIRLSNLEKEYIRINAEFHIGEKVKIITPRRERFAYINKILLSGSSIRYRLLRQKKDGSPSKIKDWCYNDNHINKINYSK